MGAEAPKRRGGKRPKFERVFKPALRPGARRRKTFTLTDALAKRFEVYAAKRGLTQSEVVMRWIEQNTPDESVKRGPRKLVGVAEASGEDKAEAA